MAKIRRARGFTLIEALIAFAIMALALSAFLGAFGEGLSGEQRAASAAGLALEARSLADEIGASIALEPGDYGGELESGTRWEVSIAEAWPQAFEDLDRIVVKAYQVTLTLEGGDGRRVRFETLRLGVP